jgi:hypothetical protein
MTVYLYCLVTAGIEPSESGVAGLAGAPVRTVVAGPVGAWVSDLPAAVSAATPELVREHDAVVRAAMAIETPIPARFGQVFGDDDAVRRSLDERRGPTLRALERVCGAVEMTVRVLLDVCGLGPAEEPPMASGRAYLAWLRERTRSEEAVLRQADFLQGRLSQAVRGVVREEARTPVLPSSRSLTVSHLVARDAVAQYRLALRAFVDSELRPRVMISGPWAPYSFAELRGV